MKVIWKIISFILVIILVAVSFISMVLLAVINSTEEYLSRENITQTIKQLDFKAIVGDKVNNELNKVLEDTGLPQEYVDKILESEKVKEYLGNYVSSGVEYILYDKQIELPNKEEVTNTIIESFDYVLNEAKNNNIDVDKYLSKEDQDKIKEEIKDQASQIVEKIPDAETLLENVIMQNEDVAQAKEQLDKVREVIDKIQIVFKYKFILYIVIVVSLALVVLLRIKQLRFVKYLMIPFALTGGSLFALYKGLPILFNKYYPEELNMIKSYIESSLKGVYATIKLYSVICLVILILLIVAQIIVVIYYHKKEDKEFSEL